MLRLELAAPSSQTMSTEREANVQRIVRRAIVATCFASRSKHSNNQISESALATTVVMFKCTH